MERPVSSEPIQKLIERSLARGSNQSGMRAHNEKLVLSLVRQGGAMSKAEIARLTGLSAQTVSVIMRQLEADGLLKKDDRVRGKIGQPSVPMSLNASGAFFLGLKIGRRSVELVLIDFAGQVVGRQRKTYAHPTPDLVLSFTRNALPKVLGALSGAERDRLGGLGVALPFRMWEWDVATGEGLEGWRDYDIAQALRAENDMPVYLCNDASAACGAELVFGDQDRPADFLYFYIGYFAGGGLVLDSKLYTGKSGNAGAVGSMPLIAASGPPLQLVQVASLATLEDMLKSAEFQRQDSWSEPGAWNFPQEIRDSWIDGAAEGLAQSILSAACLIDFESAFIDGTLPDDVRAELVRRTRHILAARPLAGINSPDVREGTVGRDARSLGAASLPLSDRFLVDRNAFLKG